MCPLRGNDLAHLRRQSMPLKATKEVSCSDGVSVTCARCHSLKVRCGQTFPCERCFRFCLPCRPRAKGIRSNSSEKKRKKEEEILKLPVLDYLFQTMKLPLIAKEFISAFMKVHSQGYVVRERVLAVLCYWRSCSLLLDADVTHGMFEGLKTICNIKDQEVAKGVQVAFKGRLPISWADLPEERRQTLLKTEVQKAQALSSHLQTTQAFSYTHTISPTTPLSMVIVDANTHRMSHAINTPYEERFRTAGEMVRDLFEHKTSNILLSAALLAQGDREAYFEAFIHGLMVKDGPSNFAHFVKAFDRHGEINLYILKVRKFQAAEGYGFIIHLHPCPPSRHISARPEHQQVSKRFRQIHGEAFQNKKERKEGGGKEQQGEEDGREEKPQLHLLQQQQRDTLHFAPSFGPSPYISSSSTSSFSSSSFHPSPTATAATAAAAATAATTIPSAPGAAFPPLPTVQCQALCTLPLLLPPPQRLSDDKRIASLFHLSSGPPVFFPVEPPFPWGSDEGEEEGGGDQTEEGATSEGDEKEVEVWREDIKVPITASPPLPTCSREGYREASSYLPCAAPPSFPFPLPARLQSTATLCPPWQTPSPSDLPPSLASSCAPSTSPPPFVPQGQSGEGGREGGWKAEVETFPAFNWPEPAGYGEIEREEGGREGGGRLPEVMNSDLDFFINVFAAEGAT